ncbi:hypothetical protein OTU49_001492, partial [Cherax quadricarinatus]
MIAEYFLPDHRALSGRSQSSVWQITEHFLIHTTVMGAALLWAWVGVCLLNVHASHRDSCDGVNSSKPSLQLCVESARELNEGVVALKNQLDKVLCCTEHVRTLEHTVLALATKASVAGQAASEQEKDRPVMLGLKTTDVLGQHQEGNTGRKEEDTKEKGKRQDEEDGKLEEDGRQQKERGRKEEENKLNEEGRKQEVENKQEEEVRMQESEGGMQREKEKKQEENQDEEGKEEGRGKQGEEEGKQEEEGGKRKEEQKVKETCKEEKIRNHIRNSNFGDDTSPKK